MCSTAGLMGRFGIIELSARVLCQLCRHLLLSDPLPLKSNLTFGRLNAVWD